MTMKPNEYLAEVLKAQQLANDSDEMKELQEARGEVEALLIKHFEGCSPTIRYGGSKAKGTMIRDDYDLDVICYFQNDETGAGETLKDIYVNVRKALQKKYVTQDKTAAIRLSGKEHGDFHIDVVPGRFVDDSKKDTFLHQTTGTKERLRTNLQTHIDHVKDSGVTDAIRLMKLWRLRCGVSIRTFPLELVTMELLKSKKKSDLEAQLTHVFTKLRDEVDDINIEDPANPQGNDLSGVFNESVRDHLSKVAGTTLSTVEKKGWTGIFGEVDEKAESAKSAALRAAAVGASHPARPSSEGE